MRPAVQRQDAQPCDFLVVGGGTAGCIVASRLAQARIGSVTLLEAGPSDENIPAVRDLRRLSELGPRHDWGLVAQRRPGGFPDMPLARAKMLGGCSNHNDAAFIEVPDADLREWSEAVAAGPEDWATARHAVRDRIRVTTDAPITELSHRLIDAGITLGLPARDFLRDCTTGIGRFPLNATSGLRNTSSAAYLHPSHARPRHLTVVTGTCVRFIEFARGRAVACHTDFGRIEARREIILAAGAIHTPQLLMVSGVGAADHLEAHDIPVVADLSAVGGHMVDHFSALLSVTMKQALPAWELTPYEVTAMVNLAGPPDRPDLQFHFGLQGALMPAPLNRVLTIRPNVTKPASRGQVRLRSPDIRHPPFVAMNYLTDAGEHDRIALRAGLEFAREIVQQDALAQQVCSVDCPSPGGNIDSQIDATLDTVNHVAGTCRMGRPGEATVVSPDFSVWGTHGLRIADASVFPSMVTPNINHAVMLVAERASQVLVEEHS